MSFTDKKESIILHTPYSRSNPVIQSFGAHPAHIDMPNGFGRFFVVLEDIHTSRELKLTSRELGSMSKNNLNVVTLRTRPAHFREKYRLLAV